jgi:hypothetical protein
MRSFIIILLLINILHSSETDFHPNGKFNLRSMITAMSEHLSSTYNFPITITSDSFDYFALSQETEKAGYELRALHVIDLWLFSFTIEKNAETKSERDNWIMMFRDGQWKFKQIEHYNYIKDDDGFFTIDEKLSWSLPPPSADDVLTTLRAILNYDGLKEKFGKHSLSISTGLNQDFLSPEQLSHIVTSLQSENIPFTLAEEAEVPYFNARIIRIDQDLVFAEINRGFPLAGPIDGYWLFNMRVHSSENRGIK